jgi:hypothetical protein
VLARYLALFCLLLLPPLLPANTIPADAAIDKHALAASVDDEATLEKLAMYLSRPCKSDRDRARAIYRWITDRIAYNAEGFFGGDYGDGRPAVVLKTRRAVCEGYTQLYMDLAKRMGLKAARVEGHAKIVSYVPGQPIGEREKHTWVAVWLDGKWQLVDPTWGAGYIERQRFFKRFFDYYFLPPPDQLVFTHLPDQSRWQLVKTPVLKAQFQRRPKVDRQLFELGVSARAVESAIADKAFRGLVQVYNHPSTATFVVEAPLKKNLTAGKEYEFVMRSDDYTEMGIIFNNETFVPMKRDGKTFSRQIEAKKGMIYVSGRKSTEDKIFSWVLGYVVE